MRQPRAMGGMRFSGLESELKHATTRHRITRHDRTSTQLRPDVRVRRNYTCLGTIDGFPTWLRRRHAPDAYVAIELEINQAMFAKRAPGEVHRIVATSLEQLLSST